MEESQRYGKRAKSTSTPAERARRDIDFHDPATELASTREGNMFGC
jgi:hypothetical protein